MAETPAFSTMSEEEQYLYDLQGFLHVRGFLNGDEVQALNEALDANPDRLGSYDGPNELSGDWRGRPTLLLNRRIRGTWRRWGWVTQSCMS